MLKFKGAQLLSLLWRVRAEVFLKRTSHETPQQIIGPSLPHNNSIFGGTPPLNAFRYNFLIPQKYYNGSLYIYIIIFIHDIPSWN